MKTANTQMNIEIFLNSADLAKLNHIEYLALNYELLKEQERANFLNSDQMAQFDEYFNKINQL